MQIERRLVEFTGDGGSEAQEFFPFKDGPEGVEAGREI